MALIDKSTAEVSDKGIAVDIYGPDGADLNMKWYVKGSDSQTYLDTERKIHNRQLEYGKRVKDFAAGLDYDQQQMAKVEKLVACVIGWEEQKEDGSWKPTIELAAGEELTCTPENVKKILKNRGFFWLQNQIQKAVDNPAGFLQKAPGSSLPAPSPASPTIHLEKTE